MTVEGQPEVTRDSVLDEYRKSGAPEETRSIMQEIAKEFFLDARESSQILMIATAWSIFEEDHPELKEILALLAEKPELFAPAHKLAEALKK